MARLVADLDDLRAAMDWAAESGNLLGLVDITEPIVRFWMERGLSRDGRWMSSRVHGRSICSATRRMSPFFVVRLVGHSGEHAGLLE